METTYVAAPIAFSSINSRTLQNMQVQIEYIIGATTFEMVVK